jgi:hypothetical protein
MDLGQNVRYIPKHFFVRDVEGKCTIRQKHVYSVHKRATWAFTEQG